MKEQGMWTWHMGAGVVILVFLGLHMAIMHLDAALGLIFSPAGGHPIDWANVVARGPVVILHRHLRHSSWGRPCFTASTERATSSSNWVHLKA